MTRPLFTYVGTFIVCSSLALGIASAAGQKGDAAKGKETFEQCAVCHNVDTDEKKMGPSLKGLFKRKTMVTNKPMNDTNVQGQINAGGNGMPAYGDMLSADEKTNLLAYLHSL